MSSGWILEWGAGDTSLYQIRGSLPGQSVTRNTLTKRTAGEVTARHESLCRGEHSAPSDKSARRYNRPRRLRRAPYAEFGHRKGRCAESCSPRATPSVSRRTQENCGSGVHNSGSAPNRISRRECRAFPFSRGHSRAQIRLAALPEGLLVSRAVGDVELTRCAMTGRLRCDGHALQEHAPLQFLLDTRYCRRGKPPHRDVTGLKASGLHINIKSP